MTAVNVPEGESGKRVFSKVHQIGEQVSRLDTIWADSG